MSVLKFLMPAVQRISDQMERMVIAGDLASYIGVDRGMVLDSSRSRWRTGRKERSARRAVVLRHDERILINAVLTQSAAGGGHRAGAEGRWRSCPLSRRGGSFRRYSRCEAGGGAGFRGVHAGSKKEDQDLLAVAALGGRCGVSEDE